MKKILIYTNFDQESEHVIHYGVEMALKNNLGVEILHVINTAHYGPDFMATGDEFTGGPYISSAIQQNTLLAKVHLKEIQNELRTKYSFLPEIHTMLKTGIDTKAIIEETSRKEIMMLILPGHGKRELFDFITDIRPMVISEAGCPVLTVPEEVEFKPYKTIIYATDMEEEDVEALNKLTEIARPFKARIIAVHVTDNHDFAEKIKENGFMELIKKKTAYDNISFFSIENHDVEHSLMQFSEAKHADIMAVLRENKNFLLKLVKRSTSSTLMKNAKIPVLIFHKH
jgi:nucleotide-binding universal stress UspA family protein